MLKKLLLSAVLVCWAGYSYSESIEPYYDQTGNAAINGNTWSMDNVLPPDIPGLDINSVIYRYIPRKNTEDDMRVHVQNENALGQGYIFRETDDWSGIPGDIEIRKNVPVIPGIPRQAWGDGSIAVEGQGTVDNANVIYSYRVDPCYDPQFDPSCPGYKPPMVDIPEIDLSSIYDGMNDARRYDSVSADDVYSDDEENKDDDEANQDEEEEKDSEDRLEKALAAAQTSALFAQGLAAAQQLQALNNATNMSSYYNKNLPGGTYRDTTQLVDSRIPENRQGLRNGLAQQLLHEKMIEMQYNRM